MKSIKPQHSSLMGKKSIKQQASTLSETSNSNGKNGGIVYPWGVPVDEPLTLKDGVERHPFDLEERTAKFGEEIVKFGNTVPRTPANDRLVGQLVGCGTSIGANYCEATEGVSKKDFRFPVSRCVKEAKETRFFLRMIAAAQPQCAEEARRLYREATELMLIFAAIHRK
jgi:four helix bundle protein